MAATTIVWLVTFVALIVVLGLVAARVVQIVREIQRITRRVGNYPDLPLFRALTKAGAEAERLSLAVEKMEALSRRAQTALATIRRGPIPPEVLGGVLQIGAELQLLREFIP